MGIVYNKVKAHWPESVINVNSTSRISEKRKRKYDSNDRDEELATPKRRRMESTMKFIYQALYIEGKESDVTVTVLGKEWHLHKIYLQQSPYFGSMFSGQWSETGKSHIDIEVNDPNITIECLNVVFSSCYTDELAVESSMVVGVLATSAHFQMEGLIDQCTEIMLENISPSTAVSYYSAGLDYGIQKVKDEVVRWLAVNLVIYCYENLPLLQDIDIDLMEKVVSHLDLCVIQTETFLYLVIRMWVYLRCQPDWRLEPDFNKACETYFRKFTKDVSFVEREEGKEFKKILRYLRVDHLVEHIDDMKLVSMDNILPESWLRGASWTHWISFLKVISGTDSGPEGVSEDCFKAKSVRLGRIIESPDPQSWKWNYFSFGVELVWTYKKQNITVQRVRGLVDPRDSSPRRKIITQVSVMLLNERRQLSLKEITGPKEVSLVKNQTVQLLDIIPQLNYPIYLQVHLLIVSP